MTTDYVSIIVDVVVINSSALFIDIHKGKVYDAMIRCDVKNSIDDVLHDKSLTVMGLLLPCISVERASILCRSTQDRWCFIIPLLFS